MFNPSIVVAEPSAKQFKHLFPGSYFIFSAEKPTLFQKTGNDSYRLVFRAFGDKERCASGIENWTVKEVRITDVRLEVIP